MAFFLFLFLRVPGHCGYCLPELPSSWLPPFSFQVTPHCEYCLPPACQGSGSVCDRPNAKGTSLILLHSLRKCGYCSAFTGVNLSVEGVVRMLGEGHQVGFEMAESTECSERVHGVSNSVSRTSGSTADSLQECDFNTPGLCNHTKGELSRPVIPMLGQYR